MLMILGWDVLYTRKFFQFIFSCFAKDGAFLLRSRTVSRIDGMIDALRLALVFITNIVFGVTLRGGAPQKYFAKAYRLQP